MVWKDAHVKDGSLVQPVPNAIVIGHRQHEACHVTVRDEKLPPPRFMTATLVGRGANHVASGADFAHFTYVRHI